MNRVSSALEHLLFGRPYFVVDIPQETEGRARSCCRNIEANQANEGAVRKWREKSRGLLGRHYAQHRAFRFKYFSKLSVLL